MNKLIRVQLIGAILGTLLPRALAQQDYQSTSAQVWRLDTDHKLPALFHAKLGSHNWVDVSPVALLQMAKETSGPEFFGDNCALSALDKDHAWLAVHLHNKMVMEYTSSGGQHWMIKPGPPANDAVNISFLNDQQGFVMTSEAPAAGLHREWVYQTSDGGEHWKEMPSPTKDGTSYYTNGIVFRTPLEGWITASYHGVPDVPLFRTVDGAKTWTLQAIPIPADSRDAYANTYPPTFFGADKKRGILPVELVRHTPAPDHSAMINYETDDGGATWHLPKSGVHSTNFH